MSVHLQMTQFQEHSLGQLHDIHNHMLDSLSRNLGVLLLRYFIVTCRLVVGTEILSFLQNSAGNTKVYVEILSF